MPLLLSILTPIFAFFTSLVSKTLIVAIGLAAAKILAWLGIGYLTYTGTVLGIDYFVGLLQAEITRLPAEFVQLVSAVATDLRLNAAFSIVLSAYAIKMTIFSTSRFTAVNSGSGQ